MAYNYEKDKDELFTGSSQNVYTFNDDQQRIKDQMNQNSVAWWSADAEGKKTLEEANKQLAANLGGSVGYNAQTGTWSGVSNQPTSMKTGVDMAKPSWDYNSYIGGNPKPTFQSQYMGQIDAKLDQILNREDFSYDLESDPLWGTLKTQYNREGDRAMRDTLATAASGAGGMNSYAISAAQQANNYHNAQLMDRIPELYQLAYSMYMDDINGQRTDLSTLMSMDEVDYGRYRDSVSDWYSDYNNAYTDYREKMDDWKWGTNFNYNAEQDEYEKGWRQTEWDHGLDREGVEDTRYDRTEARELAIAILQNGGMPSSDLLAQAGISDADAKALKANLESGIVATGGGGGDDYTGGGDDDYDGADDDNGGGWDNDGLTEAQVMDLQRALGVTEDGKFGKESREAAGGYGFSAKAAYNHFVKYPDLKGEDEKPDEAAITKFYSSVNDLGIGPVNAELVEELAMYGGVVDDGVTVRWANGWNANNYQEKLAQMRKVLPGWGITHSYSATDFNL